MRILFLIAHFPGFGGIEKVTGYIASALAAKGHEVRLLAGRNTIPAEKREHVEFPSIHADYLPDEANMVSDTNREFINEYLLTQHPDVVIYQDSYVPDLFSLLSAELLAKRTFRLIVVEHNMPRCHMRTLREFAASLRITSPADWARLALYAVQRTRVVPRERSRHRALLSAADKYVVLAEAYVDELMSIVGENYRAKYEEKVVAIPNPTTIDIPTTLPEKKKQCLFVARLERDKGVDMLVEIWRKFHAKQPDWELLIIGSGRYFGELQTMINAGSLPNVCLMGVHHDMRPFYSDASMLLLTSRMEGWVLVLAEAMAHATTPVAFNSYAALSETITNGEEGRIIPAFRQDAFVEAMNELATDTPYEMRMAAVRRARELHIDNILPRWEEIL